MLRDGGRPGISTEREIQIRLLGRETWDCIATLGRNDIDLVAIICDSLRLPPEVLVVRLLPELRLEARERPVLGEQLVAQARDLVVRLLAHLQQRRLQRVDPLRQAELRGEGTREELVDQFAQNP